MSNAMSDRLDKSGGYGVLASLRSLTESFMTAHVQLQTQTADSLMLAVIAASQAPLVLFDGGLRVIAASTSFCSTFALEETDLPGRELFELGEGEWNGPPLWSLLGAAAAGSADLEDCEMDFGGDDGAIRHLVLHARKLDYADTSNVRVLLTVRDVTADRLAEKRNQQLLHQKDIQIQEVQHRAGNSLQIIASVLLQDARKTQSEEARIHLRSAHHRVMSVATLQQNLSLSGLETVALRSYLKDLCASIGDSMILDPGLLSLELQVDDSTASADISVGLGLIVTELVINALKHAFPTQGRGTIMVRYAAQPGGWTLSVGDDGIGIPDGPGKAGLGTSIVDALADKLAARVTRTRVNPGTLVSVVHA